jgi:hypothetical protein
MGSPPEDSKLGEADLILALDVSGRESRAEKAGGIWNKLTLRA